VDNLHDAHHPDVEGRFNFTLAELLSGLKFKLSSLKVLASCSNHSFAEKLVVNVSLANHPHFFKNAIIKMSGRYFP